MPQSPAQTQFSLAEPDNQKLASLCGALDQNLRSIENALNVRITRRGTTFIVEGEDDEPARTVALLKRLYAGRHPLTPEELQLAIIESRHTAPVTDDPHYPPVTPVLPPQSPDNPVIRTRRGELQGRTPNQRKYLKNILSHDLTFGIGPAGTGKTYLAVACAIDALDRDQVERIILTRPAVEAGERLGFLPGDLTQKIDPYLRPLFDALNDLMGYERVVKLTDRQQIEIAPLAYMRGRTLSNAFIILDEAQNTTPEQMKMFLTRIGFGAKAVITGDVTQIDLPAPKKSGLVQAERVLKKVKGIGFSHFDASDVVRHPLVARIVEAYEKQQAEQRRRANAPTFD
ncbi:MAG: PhoH family protein [Lautropia sp.]|nr:PhoH family protein [Lautropia sp.]